MQITHTIKLNRAHLHELLIKALELPLDTVLTIESDTTYDPYDRGPGTLEFKAAILEYATDVKNTQRSTI